MCSTQKSTNQNDHLRQNKKMWSWLCRRSQKIAFHTHYVEKYDEVEKLLGVECIRRVYVENLPTWEDVDLSELARLRCAWLYKALNNKPCFLEEFSLELDKHPGFPGHSMRDIVANKSYFRQWVKDNNGQRGTARLVVAYIDKTSTCHIFEATQRGMVCLPKSEKEWNSGIGIDPVWMPDNSGRTLGQRLSEKHWIDYRLQLYLSFRELINPNVGGTFEIHITMTVDEKDPLGSVYKFQNVCAEYKVKPLVIFEQNSQVQLQTAIYVAFDTISDASRYAYDLSDKFAKCGFEVVRTRCEAMAYSKYAPRTDGDSVKMPLDYYFEYHQRVDNVKFDDIQKMIGKLKYDKNVKIHASQVGHKVFVNMRVYECGRDTVEKVWSVIISKIGHVTKKALKEYVVADDFPDMDEIENSPCRVTEETIQLLKHHNF